MIHSYEYAKEKINDLGVVVAVRDYIIQAEGLVGAKISEGIALESGQHGYVIRVDEKYTWIVIFTKDVIVLGTNVARTGSKIKVSCGDGLLGHVVSSLGYVMDGNKEASQESESVEIDRDVWGIDKREPISKPLLTGKTLVDLTLPLGAGQRELVIGERKTGKTWFTLETMANQVRAGKIGIYCAIGKQSSEIVMVKEWLEKNKVFDKVILIASGSRDNQAEVVMTPFTAMSIAESMRDRGEDVVIVFDDLTTHAKYYREISLSMGKFPGRDSYPGDIFYLHSKLLERAGCFKTKLGPKSISCLAIAESMGSDLTGYIQTNLMSITDGHIFFDIDRFQHGARPAINIFLSVTRVGRQTRSRLIHAVSTEIYTTLKAVESAKMFTRFGPEQTDEVKNTIIRGENIDKMLIEIKGRLYEEWEMLYLYVWYRKEEKILESPEDILKKIEHPDKKAAWKKIVDKAATVGELLKFIDENS